MTPYLPENAKMRSDPSLVSSEPHAKPVLKKTTDTDEKKKCGEEKGDSEQKEDNGARPRKDTKKVEEKLKLPAL